MRRYGNADWDAAKQRWASFWARDSVDRPVAVIFAWDEAFHSPPAYETPEQKHTDPAYQAAKHAHNLRHTHRLGENFNTVRLDLGPVSSARLFGARPQYGDQTIWHEPVASSVGDALDIMRSTDVDAAIDRYMAIYDRLDALDVCGLDAMPAQPDPGGPADLLAMLVGPEAMCMDLMTEPGLCREALSVSAEAFGKLLGRMTARLGPESSDWLNLYCQEGYVTIGEDITALVGPGMVREFFVPAIRTATQGVDNLIFHWHTGAMNTLDAILEMDEVSVLQWTSDVNHLTNPPTDHIAAIKRIIDAGKRLFVYIDPSHIDAFARAFPADGVAFGFNADSVEHGERILRQLEAAYRR